jgi:hypothetical protein
MLKDDELCWSDLLIAGSVPTGVQRGAINREGRHLEVNYEPAAVIWSVALHVDRILESSSRPPSSRAFLVGTVKSTRVVSRPTSLCHQLGVVLPAIAASRTPPWLPSGWGCRGWHPDVTRITEAANQGRRFPGCRRRATPEGNHPGPDRTMCRLHQLSGGLPSG